MHLPDKPKYSVFQTCNGYELYRGYLCFLKNNGSVVQLLETSLIASAQSPEAMLAIIRLMDLQNVYVSRDCLNKGR